jgi:hypothetical protein
VLTQLPSRADVAFYECPACGRQYCLQPGKQLTFRWLHPISLPLYGVIFEDTPTERAEADAKLFVKQKPPAYLRTMVEEIRLELRDPTQQVRDIVGCTASELNVREFLRLFADNVDQLMANKDPHA